MPKRMLRDWTDSEAVSSLSPHGERLFVRLIMKADDYGRFTANPKLIRASLFPLLIDQIREADISRWLAECEKAGLIALYQIEDKPLLEIRNFGQRLRDSKPKYPAPPWGDSPEVAATSSGLRPESDADAETDANTPQPPRGGEDGFARFWQAYPRKVGKAAAEKAWKRLKPPPELLETMLAALGVAKTTSGWTKDGGQFIPHPSTWLNGRRWEDEVRPGHVKAGAAVPDAKAQLQRLGL